jgi:hypothetical protein
VWNDDQTNKQTGNDGPARDPIQIQLINYYTLTSMKTPHHPYILSWRRAFLFYSCAKQAR